MNRRATENRLLSSPSASTSVALAVSLVLSALAPAAWAEDAVGLLEAKPYVVSIHADWCGTCRMLEKTWLKIEAELGDRAHLVKLDVSDRGAAERSLAEAERLGLNDFFREYRASTGTIGVIDGKTFEPIAIMRGEPDFSKYREAVEKARR